LGGSLPGPRCVAFRVATRARHEMLPGGVGKLPRRYGPGEGTPQPLRERSPLGCSNSDAGRPLRCACATDRRRVARIARGALGRVVADVAPAAWSRAKRCAQFASVSFAWRLVGVRVEDRSRSPRLSIRWGEASGVGGVGALSQDPCLLGSFPTPASNISWRARVAKRNATQRGLGRAPPPRPPRRLRLRAAKQKRRKTKRAGATRDVHRARPWRGGPDACRSRRHGPLPSR
jgi:hypothetical protein